MISNGSQTDVSQAFLVGRLTSRQIHAVRLMLPKIPDSASVTGTSCDKSAAIANQNFPCLSQDESSELMIFDASFVANR